MHRYYIWSYRPLFPLCFVCEVTCRPQGWVELIQIMLLFPMSYLQVTIIKTYLPIVYMNINSLSQSMSNSHQTSLFYEVFILIQSFCYQMNVYCIIFTICDRRLQRWSSLSDSEYSMYVLVATIFVAIWLTCFISLWMRYIGRFLTMCNSIYFSLSHRLFCFVCLYVITEFPE